MPFRRSLRDTERRILRTVALGIFEPLKLRQDPLAGLAPRRDPTTPSYLLAVGVFWRSLFRLLPLPMAPFPEKRPGHKRSCGRLTGTQRPSSWDG